MRLKIFLLTALLTCFALTAGSARADGITVQNASFEQSNTLPPNNCGLGCSYNVSGVPDWVTTGLEAGSWQPGTNGLYFNSNAVPDGNTIAYVVDASLSQDLGIGLQPNSNYTLSVDVGDRLDGFLSSDYTIALELNGVTMCSFTGDNADIAPGTFAPETCSFVAPATVPSGDLSIVLSDLSGQATFDDVTVSTPEPTSAVLLAVGLLFVVLVGGFYKRKHGLQSEAYVS
ncbi:MAG: hypothetical protein WBV28_03940 [Terracidiphilus sp.]